jgi:hypothetical protein
METTAANSATSYPVKQYTALNSNGTNVATWSPEAALMSSLGNISKGLESMIASSATIFSDTGTLIITRAKNGLIVTLQDNGIHEQRVYKDVSDMCAGFINTKTELAAFLKEFDKNIVLEAIGIKKDQAAPSVQAKKKKGKKNAY